MKNIGFFKKLYNSIVNFDSYIERCIEKQFKSLTYIIKLTLLVCFILSVTYIYKIVNKDVIGYIKNNVSYFKYESGILQVNEKVDLDVEDIKIIVDTSSTEENNLEEVYKEEVKIYENSIIALRNKIIIKQGDRQSITNYPNEDFSFDKNDLNSPKLLGVYIIVFLGTFPSLFMIYIIEKISSIIFLSLLILFTSYILRVKLKYYSISNICIYAYTLPIIIELILLIIQIFTGFKIYNMHIMSSTVSYIYALTALLYIRENIVKQQIEYIKDMIKREEENIKKENEEN